MRNFKLELRYDGSRYRGWQRQGNTGATIQGKVESALSRILEQPIEISGAGRTDAGVHALQQFASFQADTALSCEAILSALRAFLPDDIGAIALSNAPARFHARLNCVGKTYLYRIWNSELPCIFERKYVLRMPDTLDENAMRRAAAHLTGEHDFAAFHTGRAKKSTVRQLDAVSISREGPELRISYSGNGFLYNMARILTGTLVEVGAGRLSPDAIPLILKCRERGNAGPTAPPQGLCLMEVRY